METFPPRIVSLLARPAQEKEFGRPYRWLPAVLGLLSLAFVCTGCVTTDSFLSIVSENPAGIPCQVVVAWSPEVRFTPDPTHGGEPTPGIAGRVYLFGQEINRPLIGDGCITVDLYDVTAGKEKSTAPLEEWRFDRDTVRKLQRRDAVGWGYTLFLPWGTYNPEITSVQLRLRYAPLKSTPLYAQTASVTLNRNDVVQGKTENSNHVIVPRKDGASPVKKN